MMTDEELLAELEKINEINLGDNEIQHWDSDEVIVKFLKSIGYEKSAEYYENEKKG
jgi:hypothetical protein